MNERQIDKLIVKTAQGDNEAFAALYEGTKRGIYAFLYSYLKHKEDTEDALQNVYLKIKKYSTSYRHGTNGRAWIFEIAKNQALNDIKKRSRTETIEGKDFPHQDEEREGSIMSVIKNTLSEEEQRIVILHVLWGYKHREIGEILSCPTGTVTSKYKRSIEKLKQSLKKEAENE